ncbi:LytR/AlgR family response regulator transcription factor [Xanthovirga aplysinae]|uniref:LytR/AlgR family response regulator transcription factor n=1 Tax=Xanthovirga aplysinae TaxID=2529853 RepID=UPI0012BD5FB5|nr:LytTR family DNA-binding domain-containing protein [Xanthovirga aplysinae]MTI29796.1 response regulator transcription factor [Xanthovirga aplysinae]
MKVVIIEDVKVAAIQLEKELQKIDPEITVLAKISTVRQAIKWLQGFQVDLIFLDIQLADGSAFEIFEEVQVDTPVIFTTAYDEYAIKAFQLNSIDYLLKPIQPIDLKNSLEKYKKLKIGNSIDAKALLAALCNQTPNFRSRFSLRVGNKIKVVELKDVAWFQAQGNDVYVTLHNGRSHYVESTLQQLETELDPTLFFRVNRQFMVSYEAIEEISVYSKSKLKLNLTPATDGDVFVSVGKYSLFKQWLDQ